MRKTYRKILDLLEPRERRRFYTIMGLMVLVAFAEVLGISMILVLLNVLSSPDEIGKNAVLSWAYDGAGFTSVYAFQVALSVVVMVAIFASLAVKASGAYAIIRFSTMRGYSISRRLLQSYLHQPYSWFLERNSANIRKSVLNEVDQVVGLVMIPCLRLLASLILCCAIVGFLLFIKPVLSMLAIVLMGGSYALIYLRLRNVLQYLGKGMLEANGERFRITQEATGGFKEVKLMGLEESYVERFEQPARRRANYAARAQTFRELPRFFLEALTIGILLAFVLILLLRNENNIVAAIPTLGVFFFSVMRVLPAAQQIYQSLAAMRNGAPVLDHIHADYMGAIGWDRKLVGSGVRPEPLPLERQVEINGVSFAYATSERAALHNISLTVKARTTVGIVGGSGAGKTTLVDIILGLLSAQDGKIIVDGVPITPGNLRAWQCALGYVPQSIYLMDDTIARNIAFSDPAGKIDMQAVERAARIAALHDFVAQDLPEGYDTFVGERGVRLSGGQRQRIGIARALYADPSLLILDEATSALDNITESIVMEAVQNIRADKTIIIIAHRLSTVRNCDTIFLLEQGRVASFGTYEELISKNATFRKMAANG